MSFNKHNDLESLNKRYDELQTMIMQTEVIDNRELYMSCLKEIQELEPIVSLYKEYSELCKQKSDNLELLENEKDEDLLQLVKDELKECDDRLNSLDKEILIALTPKDERDDRNVFVEIRAGAGGEEAALFASSLYRMYLKYADSKSFRSEELELSESERGGVKEVVFAIKGKGAFSKFKYEMGVHRVQRVPVTESGGRVHTSTVTVAVMAEVDDVEVTVDPKDLRIDTYRASGAGGQHVNMTDSAIRITHIPTGLVVTCQDERSQIKNREKAMKVLKAKLYELELKARDEAIAEERRSQVGTGDRSERIRTYNYPQGRVSDHRIGLTLYKLPQVLEGDLDELIDALTEADFTERANANKA